MTFTCVIVLGKKLNRTFPQHFSSNLWNLGIGNRVLRFLSDGVHPQKQLQIVSKKRVNFPDIGHYETWLIDALQILNNQNHNISLFRDWCNALDCESFGTKSLHDHILHNLLDNAEIYYNTVSLTSDQNYIAKAMGNKLPFLPIN